MVWSEVKKGFEFGLAESKLLYRRDGAVWVTHRYGRKVRLIPAYEAGLVRIEAETGIENPGHRTETFALMRHLSVFSYKRGELRFDTEGRIVYGCEIPIEGGDVEGMVSCMAASASSAEHKLRECVGRGRIHVEDELDDRDDAGGHDEDDDGFLREGGRVMGRVRDIVRRACSAAASALERAAGLLEGEEGGRR